MKKIALTIAIILGMSIGVFAQQQSCGGLFQRGYVSDESYYGTSSYREGNPLLPNQYGNNGDFNGETGEAPLGSGIALLVGLGAGYMFAKRHKED